MRRFHHDGQAVGLGLLLNQVCQLHHRFFLNLRAAHDPLGHAGVFTEANHIGALVGHHPDPHLADHRAKVVAAGAAHGDGADDHQLVQMLGVGEFGDCRGLHIAALEDLVHIHLGHAAGGVLGIVVTLGVYHHAVQHAFHFAGHFVQQLLQLAGFNEIGNVVIGVKAFARRLDALADFYGDRGAFVGIGWIHGGVCFHQHGSMLPALSSSCLSPTSQTA